MREVGVEDVAVQLAYANQVIFVPGYGMATAQAQHIVRELSDVLEKKKEYETVPVLRNLVPAQVLMGNSSFNTGSSISGGLPVYARNRIEAVAAMIERE